MLWGHRDIVVRGAREHNLKDVSVAFPKHCFTIVVGPSGSGKSTLVVDVVAREANRRIDLLHNNATATAPPKVDSISGLSFVFEPGENSRAGGRTTVGHSSRTLPLLARLFCSSGTRLCPVCGGIVSHDDVVAVATTLKRRKEQLFICAPVATTAPSYQQTLEHVRAGGFSRVIFDEALDRLEAVSYEASSPPFLPVVIDVFSAGGVSGARAVEALTLAASLTGGIVSVISLQPYQEQRFTLSRVCANCGTRQVPVTEEQVVSLLPDARCDCVDNEACQNCFGSGLSPAATRLLYGSATLGSLLVAPLDELLAWCRKELESADSLAEEELTIQTEILRRLLPLSQLGLGHLSLCRQLRTLSRGEMQRVALASGLGTEAIGVTYICDEPAAGLHPRDAIRLADLFRSLVRAGNTVVAIDHNPTLSQAADHEIAMGPGAGAAGGSLVYSGVPRARTQIADRGASTSPRVSSLDWLVVETSPFHNLAAVTVGFPLTALTVVCGVSGSGKTSLVIQTVVPALRQALSRDGVDVGGSAPLNGKIVSGASGLAAVAAVDRGLTERSRSSVAAAVGLTKVFGALFSETVGARMRGLTPRHFQVAKNSSCSRCGGNGQGVHDFEQCGQCEGTGFSTEVLSVVFKGRNYPDTLKMTVDEARQEFSQLRGLVAPLVALAELGLGYLPLYQAVGTLSHGERQRLSLVPVLAQRRYKPTFFVFEEPTSGLDAAEAMLVIKILRRLTSEGHTVVAIEHNPTVIRAADNIIELGPGAGSAGGRIISQGSVESILTNRESIIREFL